MINNHVYVPPLLRLTNDVEENSGPRTINDPTYTVHADVNVCKALISLHYNNWYEYCGNYDAFSWCVYMRCHNRQNSDRLNIYAMVM